MTSVVKPFEVDAGENNGYIYTTSRKLSSKLALGRMKALMFEATTFRDRKVLDAGCGDGFFTMDFFDRGHPKYLVAVDAAKQGVAVAKAKSENRPIGFLAADLEEAPFADDSFDVVVLQGVLHHVDNPQRVIREAFRIAPEVVLLEPNGNNLGLKLIEKLSGYHREHEERSFSSPRLAKWIGECHARILHRKFGGFVPMFCPQPVARLMKVVEPFLERSRVLSKLGCAVIVIVARRV